MIERVATTSRLLVACDFDGTLAPIVEDPEAAMALPEALSALTELQHLADTSVVIVSGRRRTDLLDRFGDTGFGLVGEHGADSGTSTAVETPELAAARERVDALVLVTPGSHAEHKPQSAVFHYRGVAGDVGSAVSELRAWVDTTELAAIDGKAVFEISAATESKGSTLAALRTELDVSAMFFAGDDTTDETVFPMLRDPDVGVKVGPGITAAEFRVNGPADVARLLEEIATRRIVWLETGH